MEAGRSQASSIRTIEYFQPAQQQPDTFHPDASFQPDASAPPGALSPSPTTRQPNEQTAGPSSSRETNRPSRAQRGREPYNLRQNTLEKVTEIHLLQHWVISIFFSISAEVLLVSV